MSINRPFHMHINFDMHTFYRFRIHDTHYLPIAARFAGWERMGTVPVDLRQVGFRRGAIRGEVARPEIGERCQTPSANFAQLREEPAALPETYLGSYAHLSSRARAGGGLRRNHGQTDGHGQEADGLYPLTFARWDFASERSEAKSRHARPGPVNLGAHRSPGRANGDRPRRIRCVRTGDSPRRIHS